MSQDDAMTVKDLEDFRGLGWEIESLRDMIEYDRRLDWHEKVRECISMQEDRIRKLEGMRQAIVDRVNSLDDPMHQRILSERYFFDKDLKDISKDIGYSYHYTSRKFAAAIAAFEETG